MSLFKKREKAGPEPAPAKEYSFVLSNSFRGYKKFPFVVYGDREAERNNERLKDADFRGKPIVFRESSTKDGRPALSVIIDGNHVGTVYDNSQILQLTGGKIDAVYAKPDTETVIGTGEAATRHRVILFVKYT